MSEERIRKRLLFRGRVQGVGFRWRACESLLFRGRVQGVGFRWRACAAADAAGATGWVRNNFDGSVSMELQGTEEQIDRVVQSLDRARYIRIEALEARRIPVDAEERRFAVKDEEW